MIYLVLGVELIYFVVLLFLRSYLSVLHRVCACIVETPALFSLTLPLVQKYLNLPIETEATLLLGILGAIATAEFATFIRLL
jgi:hypothetical protein